MERDSEHVQHGRRTLRPEWRIAVVYFVIGTVWILFSDHLLYALVTDDVTRELISTLKGWFFISVTGAMLFIFLRRSFHAYRSTEKSLAETNLLLESVFDSLTESLFIISRDLRLQFANHRAEDLLGGGLGEADAHSVWGLLYQRLSFNVREYAERAIGSKEAITWEVQAEQDRWWQLRFHPFAGGFALYIKDVTGVRLAERRERDLQREREELLMQLQMHVNRMPIGYVVTDGNFRLQSMNPTAERMFKFDLDELRGRKPYGLIIPRSEEEHMERVRETLLLGHMAPHVTLENLRKDGSTLITEWYNTPILDQHGNFDSLVSMVIDVSERARAIEALQRSEARYRAIVEAQTEWIVRCRPDGTLTYVNDVYCRYYSTVEAKLIGTSLFAQLSEENRRIGLQLFASLTRANPTWEGVLVVTSPDGEMQWHWWSVRALFEHDDSVLEIQCVGRDITDQKMAEKALRESEERYRVLIERANDGILLIQDGIFVSCNPSAAEMLGLDPGELIGAHPEEISPEYQPDGATSAEKATRLIHDSIAGSPQVFEWIHLRKDGSRAVIEVSLTRIELQGQPVLLCFWRDITLRKETEREILLSRTRLRALAERLDRVREEERLMMSREIHDGLGQSLTALKIDLSYLRRLRQEGTRNPSEEDDAIQSMNSLVEQTISQARHLAWQMRPGMLDQLGLEDALRQHAHDMTRRTSLTFTDHIDQLNPQPEARTALALYRIAQEAITNILRHADAGNMVIALRTEGHDIVLEILDDGIGIQPKEEHEPLTTIGLVSMRERAELLGGSLRVEQRPEGGTRIQARVPMDRP